MLDKVHITVNKNAIPFDPQKPSIASGIRLGAPSITARGFDEEDSREVANLIVKIIKEKESAFDEVSKRVKALTDKHPIYNNLMNF